MTVETTQLQTTSTDPACDLGPGEVGDRVGAWRSLAIHALGRTVEPGRIVTEYARDDEVRTRLETLIAAESACCPFLEFEIREGEDLMEVEVRFPPEFEAVVSTVVGGEPGAPQA